MKELLTTLFRRKWHVAGFFALMVGLPLGLSYIVPARYEATATLLLTSGRYKKPFVPTERDSRTPFMQVSMEDVGSEVEILLSRPVLAEVVDQTGLDRECDPAALEGRAAVACSVGRAFGALLKSVGLTARVPPREAAIDRLHRKVTVEFIKRTNVIEVTWRGPSPGLARDVVNALVEAYLRHHIVVHGNTYALEAIQRQADDDSRRLAEAENRFSEYSARHAISDVEAQHAELLSKLSDAEGKVNILRGMEGRDMPGDELGALAGDPAFVDMSRRLTDAELRRVELSSRFTPDATQVVAVNREIAELRKLIRERIEANLSKWRALADTYRRELGTLDQRKVDVARMRREIEDLTERERLSRENLAEVLMSKGLDQAEVASVKVVEYAEAQTDPAFPKRLLILIVSVFLGVIGAPTWGVAVDRMSGKVLSVSDLETSLGLPVLASLPEYDGHARTGGGPDVARLRRDLIPVERTLGLDRPGSRGAWLVTSPSRGAGASLVATALARSAADRGGGPTVLVSLRVPGAGPIGDQAPGPLFEHKVIEAGKGAGTATGGAEAVVDAARAAGAQVVIDIPGHDGNPLFLKLLPHVEAVVIVAAYDHTGRHPLARMADLIRRHGGRIAGCVFNRRRNPIPDAVHRRLFW